MENLGSYFQKTIQQIDVISLKTLFNATQVDGIVNVEVKTSAPRVLGATGVKQDVLKYLSEEEATEYTQLVEGAMAIYKDAKGQKALKPEEMNAEQLEAYIGCFT